MTDRATLDAAELPGNLVLVRSTPLFDAASLPKALREDHSTKEGTWGRICILSGQLRYEVRDPRRAFSATILTPQSSPAIIEPTILHRVEPVGAVQFKVEFWRAP
jgi:tellurite resistance-related uncharacterized protein